MTGSRLAAAFACVLLGCSDELASEGEPCVTSAQCAAGLLCDTALDPPACARMGSPHPDLRGEQADLAGVDLAGDDLSAVAKADLSGVDLARVDMAQSD